MEPIIVYRSKFKALSNFLWGAVMVGLGLLAQHHNATLWAWLFFLLGGCLLVYFILIIVMKPQKLLEANERGIFVYNPALFHKSYPHLFFPWQDISRMWIHSFVQRHGKHVRYKNILALGALTPEILENQQLNLQAQKALMDTWDDQYASFMVLDCANIWMRSNTLLEKLRNYAAFAKRFTV